jgi:MFS family permease
VPVAVVAALGVRTLRGAGHTEGGGRLDVQGAVLATTGLVAIVFGCSRAATLGWRSIPVVGLLVGGLALLAGFAAWERRVPAPLLPPRILADRNRIGAYLAVASSVAGLLGSFLLLTYFVQVILGYDAIHAGLAFLPLSVAVVASSQLIAARLGPKVAPRTLIVPGMLVAATGMALLNTVAATATPGHCPGTSTTASAAAATVHGYTAAAGVATAIVAEGALLAAVLITAKPHQQGSER